MKEDLFKEMAIVKSAMNMSIPLLNTKIIFITANQAFVCLTAVEIMKYFKKLATVKNATDFLIRTIMGLNALPSCVLFTPRDLMKMAKHVLLAQNMSTKHFSESVAHLINVMKNQDLKLMEPV